MARKYGIRSLPHFKLYDENGRLLKQGFKIYRDILSMARSGR